MGYWQSMKTIFSKPKPKWASLCSLVYTDKSGRKYYKYNDPLDMCVKRKGEIDKCLMELKYGSNYSDVLFALKTAINQPDKAGNIKPDLVNVGYLVNELADRSDILLVPEILFKLCSNMLIRADENPYIVDVEILNEKVETFTKEIQRGGLHDFFQVTGLLKLIGLSGISKIGLMQYMTASEMKEQENNRIQSLISDNLLQRGLWVKENITLMN
jgi:hypothetical protein